MIKKKLQLVFEAKAARAAADTKKLAREMKGLGVEERAARKEADSAARSLRKTGDESARAGRRIGGAKREVKGLGGALKNLGSPAGLVKAAFAGITAGTILRGFKAIKGFSQDIRREMEGLADAAADALGNLMDFVFMGGKMGILVSMASKTGISDWRKLKSAWYTMQSAMPQILGEKPEERQRRITETTVEILKTFRSFGKAFDQTNALQFIGAYIASLKGEAREKPLSVQAREGARLFSAALELSPRETEETIAYGSRFFATAIQEGWTPEEALAFYTKAAGGGRTTRLASTMTEMLVAAFTTGVSEKFAKFMELRKGMPGIQDTLAKMGLPAALAEALPEKPLIEYGGLERILKFRNMLVKLSGPDRERTKRMLSAQANKAIGLLLDEKSYADFMERITKAMQATESLRRAAETPIGQVVGAVGYSKHLAELETLLAGKKPRNVMALLTKGFAKATWIRKEKGLSLTGKIGRAIKEMAFTPDAKLEALNKMAREYAEWDKLAMDVARLERWGRLAQKAGAGELEQAATDYVGGMLGGVSGLVLEQKYGPEIFKMVRWFRDRGIAPKDIPEALKQIQRGTHPIDARLFLKAGQGLVTRHGFDVIPNILYQKSPEGGVELRPDLPEENPASVEPKIPASRPAGGMSMLSPPIHIHHHNERIINYGQRDDLSRLLGLDPVVNRTSPRLVTLTETA